jgi:hypothetical protein
VIIIFLVGLCILFLCFNDWTSCRRAIGAEGGSLRIFINHFGCINNIIMDLMNVASPWNLGKAVVEIC